MEEREGYANADAEVIDLIAKVIGCEGQNRWYVLGRVQMLQAKLGAIESVIIPANIREALKKVGP